MIFGGKVAISTKRWDSEVHLSRAKIFLERFFYPLMCSNKHSVKTLMFRITEHGRLSKKQFKYA